MGIGFALGEGIGAAANVVSTGLMEQYKSDIERERQEALLEIKAQKDRETNKIDLQNKADVIETDRRARAGVISKAQEAAEREHIVTTANKKYDYTNDDGSVSPATFDEIPDEDAAAARATFTPEMRNKAAMTGLISSGRADEKDIAGLVKSEELSLAAEARNDKILSLKEQIANMQDATKRVIGAGKTGANGERLALAQDKATLAEINKAQDEYKDAFKGGKDELGVTQPWDATGRTTHMDLAKIYRMSGEDADHAAAAAMQAVQAAREKVPDYAKNPVMYRKALEIASKVAVDKMPNAIKMDGNLIGFAEGDTPQERDTFAAQIMQQWQEDHPKAEVAGTTPKPAPVPAAPEPAPSPAAPAASAESFSDRQAAVLTEARRQSDIKNSPIYKSLDAKERDLRRAGKTAAANDVMEQKKRLLSGKE